MRWPPGRILMLAVLTCPGMVSSLVGCDLGHPPADLGDALTAQESLSACGTEEGPLAGEVQPWQRP